MKIFGIEDGETIGEMSSDKSGVSFDVPAGGKVRLTAETKGDAAPAAFSCGTR